MEFLTTNTTRAEIDFDALVQNYQAMRGHVGAGVKACCVLKSNAYGHGAVEVARSLERAGADYFAVANCNEAYELRRAGIITPVLVLGFSPASAARGLAENDITQCVYSLSEAQAFAKELADFGKKLKVHIKVDTGMSRLGFRARGDQRDQLDEAVRVCRMPELDVEGAFTHFSVADEADGRAFTQLQYGRFLVALDYFKSQGIEFKIRHTCASAGAVAFPEYAMDMARHGLVLYGVNPLEYDCPVSLVPVMTLKTVIAQIKDVYEGDDLCYGRTYKVGRQMRVATLPIGYADGLLRNKGEGIAFVVAGHVAPVVGRICMDQCIIDVTDIDCKQGDEVIVFGQGGQKVEQLSALVGTIPNEILCRIPRRVAKVVKR